jgi:hypothetical protein
MDVVKVVCASTAVRQPAFDHTRLAAAIAKATGKTIDPKRLSIDELQFDAKEPVAVMRCEGTLPAEASAIAAMITAGTFSSYALSGLGSGGPLSAAPRNCSSAKGTKGSACLRHGRPKCLTVRASRTGSQGVPEPAICGHRDLRLPPRSPGGRRKAQPGRRSGSSPR